MLPSGVGTPQSFYADASVYDILHTPGTAREVDGLARIEARYVPAGSRGAWLEPACGTGRYLRVAARRGARVVGFDRSSGMVAYARQRQERLGLGGTFFEADMTGFASGVRPRCGFAFNPINSVRHLMSDAAMLEHLGQMAIALRRGGVYALGLSTCAYGLERESEDVWTARRGGTRVRQVAQYLPPVGSRRERVISHIDVETARGSRSIDSVYGLRSYSREQWRRLVGRSAMRVVGIVDEDGREMEEPVFGYAVYVLRAV